MYDTGEIKDRVDLVALIEESTQLKKSGASYLGMCPFHHNTKSPALAVFPNTKTWKCFGACGDGGDAFSWWMKRENCDFTTAVKALAEKAGVSEQTGLSTRPTEPRPPAPLPEGPTMAWRTRAEEFVTFAEKQLWSEAGERAMSYLEKERGLFPETIQAFRLGYNPTNLYDDSYRWGLDDGKRIWLARGIVIPGLWRGQPWYVKIRRPRPKDSLAKYIGPLTPAECISDAGKVNPQDDPKFGGPRGGHSAFLFGHYTIWGKRNLPVLMMTEGEWDAILGWQWGQDLCDVGTFGGVTSRADSMRMAILARYAAIGVVMDGDEAGRSNVQKYWAQMANETERIRVVEPPDHDLTDYQQHTLNLRAWMAGVVADLLDGVLEGMESAPENWVALRDWSRSESYVTG